MTDSLTSTHALADAERAEWRATCDDLHERLATMRVEADRLIAKVDAADQRTRSLDAALTAERETSRGLVAQVDTWRDAWARVETIIDEAFGPFAVSPVDDTLKEMERGIHGGIRAAQELAAIRDLVAPGNPQGTVVDAVRARLVHARADAELERDAAIARAEKAEAERDVTNAAWVAMKAERDNWCQAAGTVGDEIATLRARVAELEARPVLTVERLADAMAAIGYGSAVLPGIPAQLSAHLGPVTLPTPDRAEELCREIESRTGLTILPKSMRTALSALAPTAPAPAQEPAEFTAATVEELARVFTDAFDACKCCNAAGIRAVLARARIHAVTAEGLAGGLASLGTTISTPTLAEALKRAAAKEAPRG